MLNIITVGNPSEKMTADAVNNTQLSTKVG